MKLIININTVEKIKEFINISRTFESDINIANNKIDGKSIMGIFSIDTSLPIDVSINTKNEEEKKRFETEMKKFQ